jgi:hypothetical protein
LGIRRGPPPAGAALVDTAKEVMVGERGDRAVERLPCRRRSARVSPRLSRSRVARPRSVCVPQKSNTAGPTTWSTARASLRPSRPRAARMPAIEEQGPCGWNCPRGVATTKGGETEEQMVHSTSTVAGVPWRWGTGRRMLVC